MSTPHNAANAGDIASKVLLPGDPLRAKFIAENFLENPVCYNEVRGMYGFTGTYKGKRVSVQGTGMGRLFHAVPAGCTTPALQTEMTEYRQREMKIRQQKACGH